MSMLARIQNSELKHINRVAADLMNVHVDLKEGLQLSKVEVRVEARVLMPDGAFLRRFDLVPVQLLQLAPLACRWPHLQAMQGSGRNERSVNQNCCEGLAERYSGIIAQAKACAQCAWRFIPRHFTCCSLDC